MNPDDEESKRASENIDPKMIAKVTKAIADVIQKARDLNLPMDIIGRVMVDQGAKLLEPVSK